MSLTHVAFIEKLSLEQSIVAISGCDFLSSPRIHDEGITGSRLHNKKMNDEQKKILSRVKKRKFNNMDYIINYFFHFYRKLLNLRDTFERIKKGPVNKANMHYKSKNKY